MTAPAYWAWASDGTAMHAWPLTAEQVRKAKVAGTKHDTICGRTFGIGERPLRTPHVEPERNHCPDCWAILNPRATSPFLDALVLPAIPRADTRWRRSG